VEPNQILPAARFRLLEIWDYTEKRWGIEQADRYLRGLYDELASATKRPELCRKLPQPRFQGVYFIRYQHHYLFFRVLEGGRLGLISVLHESMDLPSRLAEDVD